MISHELRKKLDRAWNQMQLRYDPEHDAGITAVDMDLLKLLDDAVSKIDSLEARIARLEEK
jgi:hypothetical protein